MRIALVTPAKAGSRTGNRHTALRWAAMLRAAGHRVEVTSEWAGQGDPDVMLALHARRSHASVLAFARAFPERPLVLALTGTDVYRDIHASREARESLELATRFITLQREAALELPRRLRAKVRVVVQSSATRLRHRPVSTRFRACVIGHLREEKDPLRAALALSHLPASLQIEVVQAGDALDEDLALEARALERGDARYRWRGGIAHARALALMASSHVLVVSSRMEGGANVVSEALRIGLPVIASRIPGNTGLLGRDWPALYPVGDERALARLLKRVATDAAFHARLLRRTQALRDSVAPESEARMLRAAVVGQRPRTRRTGPKLRRCAGQAPCWRSAARCSAVG